MSNPKRRMTAPVSVRVVRGIFAVALLLGPLSTSAGASADLEGCFLAGINSQRAAAGAGSLAASGSLAAYGRSHSEAMASTGEIFHSAPGALAPHLPAAWESWGENVGMASDSATCQPLLTAFLNSPNHRANLLNPAFDVAGIGVFVDSGGAMWTTHVFVAINATTPTTTTASTTTTTSLAPAPTTTTATVTTTTATTTTLAPTSTTLATPSTTAPPPTTLPIGSPGETPSTTATAAAAQTPSPGHDDAPTTTTAGAVLPPASSDGDGRGAAPPDRGEPSAESAVAGAPATPRRGGCDGPSCLGFALAAVGLAGLAVGAMALWAVRR